MNDDQQQSPIQRRRELRANSTEGESLLWAVLRAGRLSGLKFRRQHSVGPFIVDFACIHKRLVVEIDGGYHDSIVGNDLSRQQFLEREGWQVLRFSNDDVLEDVEAVAIAIARHVGVELTFRRRPARGSSTRHRRIRG